MNSIFCTVFVCQGLTLPENIKLALGVLYPYDVASYILLFLTIFIFFEKSYMTLNLFFSPLCIRLVGSLKNISEFFDSLKFFLILKIISFL